MIRYQQHQPRLETRRSEANPQISTMERRPWARKTRRILGRAKRKAERVQAKPRKISQARGLALGEAEWVRERRNLWPINFLRQ
jgi:hypothetical protein